MSWSADGTYPKVQVTDTATMTQPGRVHDLSIMRDVVDATGKVWRVPAEYVAKASKAAVAATPGSYWFDSANTDFYIHKMGGGAPVLNTDVVIQRSTVQVFPQLARLDLYLENLCFIGGINIAFPDGTADLNECLSAGSFNNGWNFEGQSACGMRHCLDVDAANDGINVHNTGANISAITRANPAVVTTTSAHNLVNRDLVVIEPTTYGALIGMVELIGNTYTVAGASSTAFQLSGVDSSAFTAYGAPGVAKARLPSSTFFAIRPASENCGIAEGSNQAITLHENVKGQVFGGETRQPKREAIANVGTSEMLAVALRSQGTRIEAANGSHPNRQVLATDAAKVAQLACDLGGYEEAAHPVVAGNAVHSVKVLHTEVPPSAALISNVTDVW